MKRIILFASTLAVLALAIEAAPQAGDTEAFTPLIKKFYEAWNTLDVEKPAPFYAKDPELTFFDLAPLKYEHGWKEYSDNFRLNVGPTFSSLTLTANNDLKVTRRGDVALTTLTFHAAVKLKDGNSMDFDGRHTLFWEKRGNKWLILHEHVSKPL